MTSVQLSLWSGSHEAAIPVASLMVEPADLAAGMIALRDEADEGLLETTLSVGGYFLGAHKSKNWRSTSAIALEWDEHEAEAVVERLSALRLQHTLVETTAIADGVPCIAACFPLSREVDSAKEFTRVASCLAQKIGIGRMSPGYFITTFFIEIRPASPVVEMPGRELHVDALQDEFDGEWINAKDFVRSGL